MLLISEMFISISYRELGKKYGRYFRVYFSKIFNEPLGELNIRKNRRENMPYFLSKLAITSLSLG